jgi:hypothetical protein
VLVSGLVHPGVDGRHLDSGWLYAESEEDNQNQHIALYIASIVDRLVLSFPCIQL